MYRRCFADWLFQAQQRPFPPRSLELWEEPDSGIWEPLIHRAWEKPPRPQKEVFLKAQAPENATHSHPRLPRGRPPG